MINTISSKDNIKIKNLIKLRDNKKYREQKSLYYIEGERIINDTPIELIDNVFIKESYKNKFKLLLNKFTDEQKYYISDNVFDKIKDTVCSQGIIATAKSKIIYQIDNNIIDNLKFILILDNIQDPGNLGTIIRVAEASGVSLVILSNDCCDIYNPKVLRSSMSSISRVNLYISNNLSDDIIKLQNNNFKVYSTIINNKSYYYNKIKYTYKTAIIIGNEGKGVKPELSYISNNNIFIPMKGNIESLNVAVATSIICYEVFNQLNIYDSK